MKPLRIQASAACALLFLAAPGLAQYGPQVQRGPTSNLAVGISLAAPNSPSPNERANLIKAPGDSTTEPPIWTRSEFPSGPNYSLEALFPDSFADIEINAHSSGNEIIPLLTPTPWRLVMANQRWMGITVSVTNDTMGIPGGLLRERRLPNSVRQTTGADLLSYYLDGSEGIDSSLVGEVVLSQPAEAFAYGGATDVREIDAIDFGIGVISHGRGSESNLLFNNTQDYFFSLTPDCISAVNANFPTSSRSHFAYDSSLPGDVPAAPNVIYHARWSSGIWQHPTVYISASELGLTATGEFVDAIAVDPDSGVTIFSTQPVVGRSQLRVHSASQTLTQDPSTLGNSVDLRDENGLIADNFVSQTTTASDLEDIDSVCPIEPEPAPANVDSHFGIPLGRVPTTLSGEPMGISVTRVGVASSTDDNRLIQITGWGQTTPQAGIVHLYLVDPYNPTPATSTYLGSRFRSADPGSVAEFVIVAPEPIGTSGGSGVPAPAHLGYAALFVDIDGSTLLATSLVSVILDH